MTDKTDVKDLAGKIEAFETKYRSDKSKEQQTTPSGSSLKGFELCIEFLGGVFIGLAIGVFFDSLFKTAPVFLVVFGVFGLAAGVLNAYRYAMAQDKENG